MSRTRTLLLTLLACTALTASAGAGQALASHSQLDYFEASTQLLNAKTRAHTVAQMQALGVKAIRVEMSWWAVAPGQNSASKPSFEAANPGSYDWGEFEAVIAEAQRLHWQVLLTVTSPVPRWATSNLKAPYITRPDDQDFEEFMTAVGHQFGSQVSLFSIWNEPNHPAFLLPQWKSNGTPESPRIYRGLYQAGYAGLQAAGLTHPRVLFGETAPVGYDNIKSLLRTEKTKALLTPVAPLEFMREALCLNSKYKKAGSCAELQMTGFADHPYSKAAGPSYVPKEADDVTIGAISRLSRALNLAAAAHAIPAGVNMYLTEFGVQSKPNKYQGVPVAQQAEYDAIAEHMAYENPRVAAFSQYLLKDDQLGGAPGASVNGGTVGFQTGLEYYSGQPKPLYYAWPIPLTVTKTGHGVSLWGLVRPSTGATRVTVLVRAKGSKRYRKLKVVQTNSQGYWSLSSSTPGQYWRVSWTSPKGVKYEGPPILASS